jgi:transposase
MMARPVEDGKVQALREWGALYPSAAEVSDELFRGHAFFDPRDLVQVKYEMLRRVLQEGLSVSEAARRFGFSRQALYLAQAVFAEQGLPGLIPRRPGPKEAHKLSQEVMAFLDEQLASDPALRSADLAALLAEQFELSVHPRSIERALNRRRKKGR